MDLDQFVKRKIRKLVECFLAINVASVNGTQVFKDIEDCRWMRAPGNFLLSEPEMISLIEFPGKILGYLWYLSR